MEGKDEQPCTTNEEQQEDESEEPMQVGSGSEDDDKQEQGLEEDGNKPAECGNPSHPTPTSQGRKENGGEARWKGRCWQ